ncbi:hypothetical protein E0E50_09620 [Azotobacter chroococcum subsp. isscasi]|uniref:hypothetical protein n=1 Tax=Azotobacter chroococcum TaxID=353 RepID=UPI00103959CF|nr:hypothetical protein [Azotobacter chroococcum]TBW10812.1 hypothetical protein E0E50_09620 [Azotobacter chroococcum subsp. isscasi]
MLGKTECHIPIYGILSHILKHADGWFKVLSTRGFHARTWQQHSPGRPGAVPQTGRDQEGKVGGIHLSFYKTTISPEE